MKTLMSFSWLCFTLLGGIFVGIHARGEESAPIMPNALRQPDIPLTALQAPQIHLLAIHPVTTHRDPFIAPIDDTGQRQVALSPQALDMSVAAQAPKPAPSARRIILHGVVIGQPNYAMIDDGGTERVVGIGDRIDGGRVRSITLRAVDVSNGLHLETKNSQ